MSSVSTSASASPAFQQGFAQLKIQQAKRNAEQAEATARALQSQAANAERNAAQAQENARNLSVQAGEAQTNAGRAREGLAAIRSLSDTSSRLEQIYDRVAKAINPESADTTQVSDSATDVTAAPVVAASTVSPVKVAPAAVPTAVSAFVQTDATVGKVVNTTA